MLRSSKLGLGLLLWVSFAHAQGIGNVGSGSGGGAVTPVGTLTSGDLICGAGTSSVQDCANVAGGTVNLNTNGLAINPTANSLINGLNINQSLSGTIGSGGFTANSIIISSDSVNVTGDNAHQAFQVSHTYGNLQGDVNSLSVVSVLTSAPNASDASSRFYTGAFFNLHMQANALGISVTPKGHATAINPQVILDAPATFFSSATAAEFNIGINASASVAYKAIAMLVPTAADATQGSLYDTMLAFSAISGASVGMNNAMLMGDMNGQFPLSITATVLKIGTGSTHTIGAGIVFDSNITISGNAWQSNNAIITGGGQFTLAEAGTTTNPTIALTNCGTNCGWYAPAIGEIGLVEGGNVIFGYSTTTTGRFSFGARVDMAGNIISNAVEITSSNATSWQLTNVNASSTVPTLVPNQASTTTGFGAQASGNISAIVAATEVGRFIATGLSLPTIATDAGHTDNTVCQDTTSHTLLFGSGTLGICLGTSSARYKHDIADLDVGLSQIMSLKPVSYKLNADHGDPDKVLYGFTAEQGGRVLPKLMTEDVSGRPNTFDYLGIVPVLVKAMQQQQAEIEILKRKIR